MLSKVKLALRITTTDFDTQLNDLIEGAKLDLNVAGIDLPEQYDALIGQAIITYCRLNFFTGMYDERELIRLKSSYDEQKKQLSMATGYTAWTDNIK